MSLICEISLTHMDFASFQKLWALLSFSCCPLLFWVRLDPPMISDPSVHRGCHVCSSKRSNGQRRKWTHDHPACNEQKHKTFIRRHFFSSFSRRSRFFSPFLSMGTFKKASALFFSEPKKQGIDWLEERAWFPLNSVRWWSNMKK